MMKWMRRMALVVSVFTMVAVLAACGGAKEEAKPAPAAPAAAEQKPAAPAKAPLDKAALLKETAVGYFSNLPANTNMLDAADLKKKLDAKDSSFVLIDIRRPEDFAKGAVAGAINIPMGQIGANIDKLPRDKQLVVSCYSGQTSGQTVAALKMAGFNAISLKGGFPSFEKAGIPTPAPAAAASLPAAAAANLDEKQMALKEAAAGYFSNIPANSNMIEAADVKKKVDAKDTSIFLLDIRKPEDFAKGHIEGAVNIPMGQLGANLDKLPKDKQIIVNCYSGQTSGQTVAVLKMAGYNAVSLKGGFPSFEKAGFQIVK
ncbi:MAG: rhodanese-like domain-containing protein [Bacillota bacterium]